MFYKIRNLFGVSTLALLISTSNNLYAQGVVTLSEEAMFDDEETPSADVLAPQKNNSADVFANTNANKPADIPVILQKKETVDEPEIVSTQEVEPAGMPREVLDQPGAGVGLFGTNDEELLDDEVFSQMSDLEKQTALLNLELRREKVKNEIEAIKNQRKQAVIQEKEKAEAQKRQKIEWEKAQEQKVLEEQQKLRELDIQFEKVRQERLLNSYKTDMLAENQKWISHDAALYKQINDLKEEKQALLENTKKRFDTIKNNIEALGNKSGVVIEAYKAEISNLQNQIMALKARIEAQERELEKRNPFAEGVAVDTATVAQDLGTYEAEEEETPLRLDEMYAVLEIRGQNGELIAKLINQDEASFYVKKGTLLQSGHEIEDITSTYVQAKKEGLREHLYFAAGGILPKEQLKTFKPNSKDDGSSSQESSGDSEPKRTKSTGFVASSGVPGLGSAMMAR